MAMLNELWSCIKEVFGLPKYTGSLVLSLYLVVNIFQITGLYRGYSKGSRTGFLVKHSIKGLIFKTFEAEIQQGVGNQASLQPSYKFSVPDIAVQRKLLKTGKQRVTVKYEQWLIAPLFRMESEYEIIDVIIEED